MESLSHYKETENGHDSPPPSSNYLESFDTNEWDSNDMSNVVWEGFGTEEDERYLSSVNPFSDAASLESTIEYRLMQADDTLIDSLHTRIPSFHIDLPRFSPLSTSKSWSSVLLKNPIPPPPLPPAPSPAPEEREEVKPKEVCRYWLAVGPSPFLLCRAIASTATSAGTRTHCIRRRRIKSWSTARSAASVKKTC